MKYIMEFGAMIIFAVFCLACIFFPPMIAIIF